MRHFCWKNTQNFAIFIIVFQKLATILADVPATPATFRKVVILATFSFIFKHLTLSENLSCYLPKFQSSSDNFL